MTTHPAGGLSPGKKEDRKFTEMEQCEVSQIGKYSETAKNNFQRGETGIKVHSQTQSDFPRRVE